MRKMNYWLCACLLISVVSCKCCEEREGSVGADSAYSVVVQGIYKEEIESRYAGIPPLGYDFVSLFARKVASMVGSGVAPDSAVQAVRGMVAHELGNMWIIERVDDNLQVTYIGAPRLWGAMRSWRVSWTEPPE